MKKRGFTLIELLAVIVILAIIALIATPIVMNVIENTKKSAAERSLVNYMNAIETAIMEERLDGPKVADTVYTLSDLEARLGGIEVNGSQLEDATVIIQDGKVADGSSFKINNYVYNIIGGKIKTGDYGLATEYTKNNSLTVYYNPVTQKECNPNQENCFTWYLLEDKGKEYRYVTLVARDKYSSWGTIAWCGDLAKCKKNNSFTNEYGPLSIIDAINIVKTGQEWKVPIGLPSAEQLANLVGETIVDNSANVINIGLLSDSSHVWTSTLFPGTTDKVYMVQNGSLVLRSGYKVSSTANFYPTIIVDKRTLEFS